jgi:choice-of-anchor C domain-containing protein
MSFAALMLIMPWSSLAVSEAPVHFADADLEAAVEAALGISDPTPADMLTLTELTANGSGITNLTGLEYAVNLTHLDLSYNYGVNISQLSELPNLKYLDLRGDNISNITAISGLTGLVYLDLSNNIVDDTNNLSDLTNLTYLNLSSNKVSSIVAVRVLKKLTYLNLAYNSIDDISELSSVVSLVELDLTGNSIGNLSALSAMMNLKSLWLSNNKIAGLGGLSGLSGLEVLYVSNNQVVEVSELSGLHNLKTLYLSNNQITDINGLSQLINLQVLGLGANQIADISALSGLRNLKWLHLCANPLNTDAYDIYIPQILDNNPGIRLCYEQANPDNLLINGSFEEGPDPLGGEGYFLILVAGSRQIVGWQVTKSTIDYKCGYFVTPAGTRSIDLDGTPGPGAIAQTFVTIPGRRYEVSFYMSGNPEGNPYISSEYRVKVMGVRAANDHGVFYFDTTGHTRDNMGWRHEVWSFTAVAETTTLEFLSLSSPSSTSGPLYYGPVIDDVCVREATYEPTVRQERPFYVDDDAPNDPSPADPDISDPDENGSITHPFDTIQEAIDAAEDGDSVIVSDGLYTGTGNRRINFKSKAITVQSAAGPAACIIDCQLNGQAFEFQGLEGLDSALRGFTIRNAQVAVLCTYKASPTISDCVFEGSTPNMSTAMRCRDEAAPALNGCTFRNYSSQSSGSVISSAGGAIALSHCTFYGNAVQACIYGGPAVIDHCTFYGNVTSTYAVVYTWGDLLVKDCIFRNNTGSTIYEAASAGAYVEIRNCTLAGNSPNRSTVILTSGGGPRPSGSSGTQRRCNIVNSILWNGGDEIRNNSGYSIAVAYSVVRGGWPGEGVLKLDPLFVNANSGDFHLSPDSPSINAGDPKYDGHDEIDIDGEPRVMQGRIDIGADEVAGCYVSAETPGDPNEDGSWEHPYDSIQEAINAVVDGDTIVVLDGVYTGVSNRNLDLKGKLITVRSLNGPQNCVIDCQHQGRGFYCHSGETSQTVIDGFTISNGQQYKGAGIYCVACNPTVRDCVISGCSPDALCVEKCQPTIAGTVEIIGSDLTGSGALQLANDATLKLSDVHVSCNIAGTGIIQVPAGTGLSVINNAVVELRNPDEPGVIGSIRGNGLLRVKDSAHLSHSSIEVASLSFEGNSVISENIITTHETTLYGQIVVKDAAAIINNDIHAHGDRYMDIEPAAFVGTLEGNRINVTVEKAHGNTEAGLFELRGRDLFCNEPNCEPGTFYVKSIPGFGRSTWTIDRLELVEGSELTLTNRFDYQVPYDSGGDTEVLYVRELVLGANSILDLAFNRLYYQSIDQHPTSVIINAPLLGFSLDKILFDQPEEFPNRVSQNNYKNPGNPNYDRVHVERVEGLDPYPTGVMQMRNLEDADPDSPTFRTVINARAKVKFAKCAETEIVVRFEYLFEYARPDTELIVYLSDVPDLLALDDPNQFEHYIEVGRISPPLYPRPGSVGSDRPGTFERTVSTESLDLTEGAWVQLELVESEQIRRLMSMHSGYVGIASSEPDGSVVDIDDIELIAHPTGVCMDLSGDYFPSENDFLILIATCGLPADVDEDGTGSTHRMDVGFSRDGYVDCYDIASCDWLLHVPGHSSLCDLPLSEGASTKMGTSGMGLALEGSLPLADLPTMLEDLLIIGKRSTCSDDRFYIFDSDATYGNCCDPATRHCNIGVVRDSAGEAYLINTDEGVSRLDGSNQKIIPPGKISGVTEPRYGTSATVSVGIRGQSSARVGRPVLDVAFDAEGYAYVVPVVVSPVGQESYLAAAKLQLKAGNPPYSVAKLYDSAAVVQDGEYRTNPREIEIDAAGNIYVLNVDRRDESDILWKYAPDGTAKCLSLGNPMDPNYVPDPVGMCVSDTTKTVYVASGQYNASDPSSSTIHVFSQETLELKRSVQIEGMQHVTGITEDPTTGSLWVVGFSMSEIPLYPNPMDDPFYQPYLAKVPRGVGTVKAVSLSDTTNDLALPMAILWTGEVGTGPSDIDRDGQVDFKDFAHLATSWKSSYGDPAWNRDADLSSVLGEEGTIDFFDLIILTEHWLDERTP